MHTAVRTKVPLKKKVRGERKKKPLPAIPQKDGVLSPTALVLPSSNIKPSGRSQKKSLESPRKLLRKKKKRSSSDENQKVIKDEQQPVKPTRSKPKKKSSTSSSSKHKEIIDYSNPESHTNTFGKVQKWLLESPIVLSAASQIEHASKMSNIMNKSHSTPEHLANVPSPIQQQQQQQQRSPNNTAKPKTTKSTNNINDKVRLQVVYKPPFKFSLKFSKNDSNNVKTNIISGGGGSGDKARQRQQLQQQQSNQSKRNSLEDPSRSRRAALLIRSATEEINNQLTEEPVYETLSHPPKVNRQTIIPNYENLPTTSSTANLIDATLNNSITSPINTATFRVNKSASGSNINNHRNLPVIATPVLNSKSRGSRGSQQNLRRSSISNSGSSGNLMKFGGSSQNLTRSSTTNLTKHSRSDGIKRRASDMNRSSTTNLNKYHRQHSSHSSNSNLRRGGSNMDVNASPSSEEYNPMSSNERKSTNGRKSSVSASNSVQACAMPGPSRRESFNNNIPRASLINSISNLSNQQQQRQVSIKPINATQPLSHQSRVMIDELNKNRPQTSSCDSSMFKNFEWPKVLTTQRSLPADNHGLQSDLEVMVSDVENLMNDS